MGHTEKEKMIETCELNKCQYDSVDGDCLSGPAWHHCTAKCATTASPTAEPTKAPTSEPTKAPTDEPTKSPTSEPTPSPTAEPTKAPTSEPTKSPTSEPTPSPSIGECPENGMDSIGDSCNGFEGQCKYDFVECC